jgi:hypothetical protein
MCCIDWRETNNAQRYHPYSALSACRRNAGYRGCPAGSAARSSPVTLLLVQWFNRPLCGVNEEGGGEVMSAEVSLLQPLYGRVGTGCANLKQDQQSIYRP